MDGNVEREFTTFVTEHAQALLYAAFALTGDQHAAEDLLQGALTKAFIRWRHIHGVPEAYVRRIIYHDHISNWRRFRRREIPVADLSDHLAGGHLDPDTALRLSLRHALQTLPARQRAVMVLRYLEDFSLQETAAMLGCRVGTVASHTARALARLRTAVPDLAWQDDSEVLR